MKYVANKNENKNGEKKEKKISRPKTIAPVFLSLFVTEKKKILKIVEKLFYSVYVI